MAVLINYKNNSTKNLGNIILFTDEKFNISPLKKYISSNEYSYVSNLIKTKDFTKNLFIRYKFKKDNSDIFKKDIKIADVETLGANFYDLFKDLKQSDYWINSDSYLVTQKYNRTFFTWFKIKII